MEDMILLNEKKNKKQKKKHFFLIDLKEGIVKEKEKSSFFR